MAYEDYWCCTIGKVLVKQVRNNILKVLYNSAEVYLFIQPIAFDKLDALLSGDETITSASFLYPEQPNRSSHIFTNVLLH